MKILSALAAAGLLLMAGNAAASSFIGTTDTIGSSLDQSSIWIIPITLSPSVPTTK